MENLSPATPNLPQKLIKKLQNLSHPEVCEFLDSGQIQAVLSDNPRTLILAGAGAGKTRVIAHRILHLIKNLNVPAGNILAVTFSKEATKEMRMRLKEAASRIFLSQLSELRPVAISTIHAFCYHILKTDGAKIYNTNFKVVGDELNHGTISQNHLLNLILSELSGDKEFLFKIKQFIIDYLIDYKELINAGRKY